MSAGHAAVVRFTQDIAGAIGRADHNTECLCREVRAIVRAALGDRNFVVACAEQVAERFAIGVLTNPPILEQDALQFSVRLLPWPQGSFNRPHRHTSWTVTGVLAGKVSFHAYRERDGHLVPCKEVIAGAGDAGYVVPPAIHRVENRFSDPSLTLHVFSGKKRRAGGSEAETHERGETFWYDGASQWAPSIADLTKGIVAALVRLEPAQAKGPLVKLARHGEANSRLAAIKGLAMLDPIAAKPELLRLANDLDEQRAAPLRRIAAGLG